jgi:hypothetical protein
MKKIIGASFIAAFAFTMLLPVSNQVNAASVNDQVFRQGTLPMPGGHGFQGTLPMPGGHGFQGTLPMPGGHGFQGTLPMPGGHGISAE